jgi:hypothetical protein
MRTSLARVVAGTAIAAAAALAAAGTASAATSTTPVKTPTTLSIVEAKAKIIVGQKDVISGQLLTGTKPVAGKVVWLYRWGVKARKWLPVEVDLTGKYGKVFFVVKPAFTSSYELVFHGTPKFAASHSGVATVVVLPVPKAPTTLSIAESASTIKAGQKDVITGTLLTGTKPVAGKVVWLYRWGVKARKWLPVEVDLTGKYGHVFYTVKPAATTSYELVFRGAPHFAPSHSHVATITVTK